MKRRCKDSKYVGCYTLKNYKLSFRTGTVGRDRDGELAGNSNVGTTRMIIKSDG